MNKAEFLEEVTFYEKNNIRLIFFSIGIIICGIFIDRVLSGIVFILFLICVYLERSNNEEFNILYKLYKCDKEKNTAILKKRKVIDKVSKLNSIIDKYDRWFK